MAQLGGRILRVLLTSLEVLSDDGNHVLMVDSKDGLGGGGVKLRVRRPWESTWGSDYPTFTIDATDADVLAKLVGNMDAQYVRNKIDAIETSDFRRDDPNTANEEAVAREVEARCSQLDIERAKAANIAEEMELLRLSLIRDHSLDKHITAAVEGCGPCDSAILASTFGSPSAEDEDRDEDDEPF